MTRATSAILLFCFAVVVATAAFTQEIPDWAKRDFAAPADQVHAAALASILAQRHELKGNPDGNTITFHVGTTSWSWGYNMELTITAIDETHSHVVIGIARSGGKTFSWGSGQKEVKKIFDGIDRELENKKVTKT
jgi:hypothetical protein